MSHRVLPVGEPAFVDGVSAALYGGVSVVDAPSIAAARSVLAAGGVDCVVAAGELPDAEGRAVVDGLRESAPDVPVVLVPERGSERLAVDASRVDGVDYVPSTSTDRFAEAADRVDAALEGSRSDGDVRLRSFRRAVEQAGHSIYVTDTDGTIRYVNPAFAETTGFPAEQAAGRTPRILKSGEHDPAFYEELWETILDGEVWRRELVNRRADGTRYVVDQTIAPIVVDGRIERFVAVNADITDRIEREERLETLHDATRACLAVTTTDGVAERACEQLAALFDADAVSVYRRDDDGRPVPVAHRGPDGDAEAPDPDDCQEVAVEPGETRLVDREDGQPASELLLAIGDYGVARLAGAAPGAFDDADVAIARVFAANLEAVLESVENYRALERQNERLDEFAGILSHDLQNPLSVATGFLDLLADRVGEDDDLRRVRESLEHMEAIISDVLWLATEGDRVVDTEPVSIRRAAERSWSLVETGDATLELDLETGFRVEADPEGVHRMLENLFANAVEHGGPAAAVRVGILDGASGFYVADDGPGVPAARREAVFDVGHSTSADGTGFGLPIVERVAEGHGWSVAVEERDPGGARFVVRF